MKTSIVQNQQGFSLIETIIAMAILSIGLLAVGLMQIGAMKGNANALGRSGGVAVAQSRLDSLRCLPLDDPELTDVDIANDNLDDGIALEGNGPTPENAGHTAANPVIDMNGQSYTVFWNIDDDTPAEGAKTVRLFVYWNDQKFGLNRVITTSVLGGVYL